MAASNWNPESFMLHCNIRLGAPVFALALMVSAAHAETPTPPPTAASSQALPGPLAPAVAALDQPAATVATETPHAPTLGEIFTWRHPASGSWMKPVLQLGSAVVNHFPDSPTNDELADRTSTLLIARFGLEGRAFELLRFKSVWERNLGYNVGRNGPLGTSIWEGTGSFSTRESWLAVSHWDFTLTAGIFTEPASVDFIPDANLDLFAMDPFVRDPLLQSGFNLGQGVMLRYAIGDFTIGLAYTGGNPLTSSLSGSFGGDVTASGTLYDAPLRDMSAGLPGSNIDVDLFSPSVTFAHDFGPVSIAARAAAQLYFVDADVTQLDDQPLNGFNYRLAVETRFLDDHVRLFGGYARRGNRQLAVPDLTRYKDDFEGRTWHVGAEVTYGSVSVGGSLYIVRRLFGDNTAVDTTTINVGAAWWIMPETLCAGVRYASVGWEALNVTRAYVDAQTFIASLRLLL